MKRIHLFEFEDLSSLPAGLRTAITNIIAVFCRRIGVTEILVDLVSRVLDEHGIDHIVDLGSGSGGAMPDVLSALREGPTARDVHLTMTDLHPNRDAIEMFAGGSEAPIRYLRESVDATNIATAPPGLKTMVNAFHHMGPRQARAILESAAEGRQPLLVYEMVKNRLPVPVWALLLPVTLPLMAILALLLTLRVRPLSLQQVVFTYIVPIVPIAFAWDAMASMPRIYTPEDLDELLEGLESPEYGWEQGTARTRSGRTLGSYLLGVPYGPQSSLENPRVPL